MAEKTLLLAGQTSFTTLVPYAVEIPLGTVTGFSWSIPNNCVSFDMNLSQISSTLDATISAGLLKQSDGLSSSADYTSLNQEGASTTGGYGSSTGGWGALPIESSSRAALVWQVRYPRSSSIRTASIMHRLTAGTNDRVGVIVSTAGVAEDHNIATVGVSTGFMSGSAHIYYTVEQTVTI